MDHNNGAFTAIEIEERGASGAARLPDRWAAHRVGVFFVVLALGCSSAPTHTIPGVNVSSESTRAQHLMGTTCQIQIPGAPAESPLFEAAFDEIGRIEKLISTWSPDSELSRVNHAPLGERVIVSGELAGVLRTALEWSEKSGGAFNPLTGPLIAAWDTRRNGRVPTKEEIAEAVSLASLRSVRLEGGSIIRRKPTAFEEGAFGKGYAIDRATAVLRRAGVVSGSIDFGGQIGVWGASDGTEVRIAHPEDRQKTVLVFKFLRDGSVATSSASEKTFTVSGRTFSHLIDPRSGEALPSRGSTTVLAETALEADIAATAAYVLGPVEGVRWANRNAIALMLLEPVGEGGYRVLASNRFWDAASDLQILDDSFVDATTK